MKLIIFGSLLRNLQTYTKENIIEEIISSTIAECINETGVNRNSLLIDSSFFVIAVMRNQFQYGRPAIEFCLKYEENIETIKCSFLHLLDLIIVRFSFSK